METQTKTQRFLEGILPEVKTKVGFDTDSLLQAMSIIFIVLALMMVLFFALQKKYK